MKDRRPLARLICAFAAMSLVTACAEADGTTEETLVLGFVVDPSWAQVPVALDLDLFTQKGVEVKVVNFPTGAEALEALNGGAIDVATAGETPTSSAIIANDKIVVIADGSRHSQSRFVTSVETGYQTLDDLEGAVIGTPIGSSAHYYASMFLEQADVEAELVQVSPSDMDTAMARGDIEVSAVFQPYQTQVIELLGEDAVEIWWEDEPYVQHSLYISLASTVQERKDDIAELVAGLAAADELLVAQDDTAMDAVGRAIDLEGGTLATVLEEFDFSVQLEPDLADTLVARAEWGIEEGNLSAGTEIPDYADHLQMGPVEALE